MTKSLKVFTSVGLILGFFFAGIASAQAAIPFLIWERGKAQNIVLGGATDSANWKIFLVGTGKSELEFSKSSPNPKKYIVYSVVIPNDFPKGAYQIEARASSGEKSVVAGVSVIERTYYSITGIPTDLRILFTLFVFFTTTFSVLRARKYTTISYQRTLRYRSEKDEESDDVRPHVPGFLTIFYKFRQRREANMEMSLLRFVVHRDGEVMHKLSPAIWAILPILSFLGSIGVAVSMQGHHALPQMSVAAYFIFTAIGTMDAFSGITAAVGLFISQLIFGDINSVRAFLLFFAFVAPWFVSSLLGSLYYMMIRIDIWGILKNAGVTVKTISTLIIVGLLSGLSVYATTVALQSMSIQLSVPPLFFLPPAALVAVLTFIKNYLDYLLDAKKIKKSSLVTTKVESLFVARVLSPGTSLVILLGVLGVTFVWTQSMVMAIVVAAAASLPFIALYISFPYRLFARIPSLPRNVLAEAALMGATTFGIFLALERLPMSVIQKSKTFILLSLIPLLLHAIYSLLEDSADRAKLALAQAQPNESDIKSEGANA